MANLTPGTNRIIVERLSEEQMSKGGIVLPDVAQEKPSEGIVVAAGYTRNFAVVKDKDGNEVGRYFAIPVRWNVGDHVLFGKYSGTQIVVEGKTLLTMHEDEVYLSIEPTVEVVGA